MSKAFETAENADVIGTVLIKKILHKTMSFEKNKIRIKTDIISAKL